MNIGQRLKEARNLRKLSQETLAKIIGVSRGVISNIEYNKVTEPQPLLINAICDALNINRDWLLSGKGNMEKEENTKSNQILDELSKYMEDLSEDEQFFILDIVRGYSNLALNKK